VQVVVVEAVEVDGSAGPFSRLAECKFARIGSAKRVEKDGSSLVVCI